MAIATSTSVNSANSLKFVFEGHAGGELAARLDLPAGPIRAFALFAHCFTCTKDILAAKAVARELAQRGIAVLRFDFTGLGASEGEFGNTTFTSNIDDLVRAAAHLRNTYEAPSLLIGHSFGGAAVLAAAHQIPEVRAVATIGAPADVEHVLRNFGSSLGEIEAQGTANVQLVGRHFRISQSFVEDARAQRLDAYVAALKRALLVLHSPIDQVVGIENASRLFKAAKHPKSFVTLDDADHLLSHPRDAAYAAQVIAAWADRYIPGVPAGGAHSAVAGILVSETGVGKFQNTVVAGRNRLLADEPLEVGGMDSGPSPYDYLSIALGACTSMTLRVYAELKNMTLPHISVEVQHDKVSAEHSTDCGAVADGRGGKIDHFHRTIILAEDVDAATRSKILEIADKCPVHRTLHNQSVIVTDIKSGNSGTP